MCVCVLAHARARLHGLKVTPLCSFLNQGGKGSCIGSARSREFCKLKEKNLGGC